jgi:hypothetical protein
VSARPFGLRPCRPILLPVFLVLALTGCVVPKSSDRPDLTGGRTLEVFVAREAGAYELYQVDKWGSLQFGGGMDAYAGSTTWSGPLTADEIEEIFAIVDANRWNVPNSVPKGRDLPLYRINYRGPERRKGFRLMITGDNAGTGRMHALLAAAAARRNEAFLDSLPKAGEPPQ